MRKVPALARIGHAELVANATVTATAIPRVGGVCDHRRCLERAHPEGCRAYAPAAFELRPGDVEIVTALRLDGWVTGTDAGDIGRAIPGGFANLCNVESHTYHRRITPAQWRALRRLEQGRAAGERRAADGDLP